MEKIVYEFMKIKNLIQIYHWQTKNYPRHIASGNYYDKLNLNVDKFIETMQKTQRINFKSKNSIIIKNISDKDAEDLLINFSNFLINDIPKIIKNPTPDLKNIRDDILSDTNQTLYLFSLG